MSIRLSIFCYFFLAWQLPTAVWAATPCKPKDFADIELGRVYEELTEANNKDIATFIKAATKKSTSPAALKRSQKLITKVMDRVKVLSDSELEHALRKNIETMNQDSARGPYPRGLSPFDIPSGENALDVMLLEFLLGSAKDRAKVSKSLKPPLKGWAEKILKDPDIDPENWRDLIGQVWGNVVSSPSLLTDFFPDAANKEVAEMATSSLHDGALWEEFRRRIVSGSWTIFERDGLEDFYRLRLSDPDFAEDNLLYNRDRGNNNVFSGY